MSAWIVSKGTIDALLTAALRANAPHLARGWRSYDSADAIGRMLWRENVRSVSDRYSKGNDVDAYLEADAYTCPLYTLYALPGKLNVGAALKLLACYEYQSCECGDWQTTDAFQWCRALRYALIALVPGYEAGPWGCESASAVLAPAS